MPHTLRLSTVAVFRLFTTHTSLSCRESIERRMEGGDISQPISSRSTMICSDDTNNTQRSSTCSDQLRTIPDTEPDTSTEVFTTTASSKGDDVDQSRSKGDSKVVDILKRFRKKSKSSPSSQASRNPSPSGGRPGRTAKSPRLRQITFSPSTNTRERYSSKEKKEIEVKKPTEIMDCEPSAADVDEVEKLTKEVKYLCALLSKAKEEREQFEGEVKALSAALEESNDLLKKLDQKFTHEETCFRKNLSKEKMQSDHKIASMKIKMKEMNGLLREWTKLGTYVSVMHRDVPIYDLLMRTCKTIPQAKKMSQQTFLEMKKERNLDYIRRYASDDTSGSPERSSPPTSKSSPRPNNLKPASPALTVIAKDYENIYEQAMRTARLDVHKIVNGDDNLDNVGNIDYYDVDGNIANKDVFEDVVDNRNIREWKDDDVDAEGIMFWELPNITSTPTHPHDEMGRHVTWDNELDFDNAKNISKDKSQKSQKRNKSNRDDSQDWFDFLEKSAMEERKRFNHLDL